MKFSIFVVTLNSGEALLKTVNSILAQKNVDFEIVVKDGCSTDESISALPEDKHIQIILNNDRGIYDAMNQAIDYAEGDYGLFMNCGDTFYSDCTLFEIEQCISKLSEDKIIFYGDCYTANRDYILEYPEVFDDYVCFTKTLCHQATVYPVDLLKQRKFSDEYKIAADFEYYVHAYKHGYKLKKIPVVVANYEGNGASETKKNRNLGILESEKALKENFSTEEYKAIDRKRKMRGFGVKRFLVSQEWFYPCYRFLAKIFYKLKK